MSTAIVVGIDGSPAASHAAVWAIDEAISRDVALRLVAVAEKTETGETPSAAAESALQSAVAAVRATGRPVMLETAVASGAATLTLLEASRTAAMVCVGAVGLRHFGHHRVGSTAGALAGSAQCPVAVIRGGDQAVDNAGDTGWVVVELDGSPESAAVLQFGVAEARLRSAPLRVLGGSPSRNSDVQLDRRISEWRHRYPDLDVQPVAVRGGILSYLSERAADIQLIVVGARNADGVGELLGPAGQAALHDTDCSVLVVDRQRLL